MANQEEATYWAGMTSYHLQDEAHYDCCNQKVELNANEPSKNKVLQKAAINKAQFTVVVDSRQYDICVGRWGHVIYTANDKIDGKGKQRENKTCYRFCFPLPFLGLENKKYFPAPMSLVQLVFEIRCFRSGIKICLVRIVSKILAILLI